MGLRLALVSGCLLVACGSSRTSGGVDYSGGGTFEASVCGASRPSLAALRCVGDANAPSVALGVCGDLVANNTLTLETRVQPATGAALAVTGTTTTTAPLHVAGSFVSYGSIEARNTQDVTGDVETAGDWNTSSPVTVGGDAFVAGVLSARNSMSIAGTLHVATGSDVTGVQAGNVAFGGVQITDPLDCAHAPDVAALVAQAGTTPDSLADAALPPDALEDVRNPTVITLGCGTYVLTSMGVNNTLSLHIAGATVLVVQGDVHIAAPTAIDFSPGATLDLAIGGALRVDNTLTIGSASQTSAAWVGVGGAISIASPTVITGWLVAPRSDVAVNNTLDVSGSALLGALTVASPVNLHDGPPLALAGFTAGATAPPP